MYDVISTDFILKNCPAETVARIRVFANSKKISIDEAVILLCRRGVNTLSTYLQSAAGCVEDIFLSGRGVNT